MDTGFLYAANCLGGNGRIYRLEPRMAIEKYATVRIPGRLICMGRTKLARNGSAGRAFFFCLLFGFFFRSLWPQNGTSHTIAGRQKPVDIENEENKK